MRLGQQKADAIRYIIVADRLGRLAIYKTPKNMTINEWLVVVRNNDMIAARRARAEADII